MNLDQLNERQQETWTSGDFPKMGVELAIAGSMTRSSTRVKPGSPSSIGFRPPPGFLTLPSSAASLCWPRSSRIPFRMVGFERPLAATMRWIPPRPSRSASRPANQRRCASLRASSTFRNKPVSRLALAAFIQPGSHKTFYIVNVILRQALCGRVPTSPARGNGNALPRLSRTDPAAQDR
jgi:hypothetical protein